MSRQATALVVIVVGAACVVGLLSMLMVAGGVYLIAFASLYGLPGWTGPSIFAFAWLLPAGFIIGLRIVRSRLQRRLPQD